MGDTLVCRAYEHDWREFNALGVPTFQCQVESGMALEPQLESPEPYALNQPPRSFYSSLTQEERAGLCCAKARLAFSMTSCTTKCSAQCTVVPTSITWQSLKVRSRLPRTVRAGKVADRPARRACADR